MYNGDRDAIWEEREDEREKDRDTVFAAFIFDCRNCVFADIGRLKRILVYVHAGMQWD